MSRTILLFLTTVFCGCISHAQLLKKYSFDGFFNGSNLSIQCRTIVTTPWKKCDCIDSILVNGFQYEGILYDGYEIDLANKIDFNTYDSVHIDIYTRACELRILNPTDFYPKTILPVSYTRTDTTGRINWAVQQNYPDLKLWVQIEQYKWGEWVRVGPIYTITDQIVYETDISDYLVKGKNRFRAVVASITQVYIPGDPVEIPNKSKKIKFKYKAQAQKITFSKKTHYELWNEKWLIASRGLDSIIDVSRLQPGLYYLRYGDRQKKIKIKSL